MNERWLIIGSFFVIYFIWGSTYLANYWAIDTIPPFGMGALRFLTAGAMMYAYAMYKRPSAKPTFRQWKAATLLGIMFLFVGVGAVVWAQQFVPTSTAALVVAFEPLVVMFMMWVFLGDRPPLKAFFGATISIAGMGLLIGQPASWSDPEVLFGIMVIFCSMFCWGGGMLLRQRFDLGQDMVRATGMQMLTGGMVMFLFSLIIGEWTNFSVYDVSFKSFASWLYLLLFGGILGYSAFNYLLTRVSAEKVSTNTYVNPVVAVLLGGLLNDEVITFQTVIAGIILLAGVWFIHATDSKKST